MPVDVLGGTAIRPVERHGMEAISWFLYNKNTGAIMGRTPTSWALITIFYIIYYACLGAFWLACLFIFFQTIDKDVPKWQMDEALITSSPAVGVRPAQSYDLIDSSLIMFTQTNKDGERDVAGWGEWVERTKEFLKVYSKQEAAKPCKNGEKRAQGEVCEFRLAELGPCKAANNFGYEKGKPCVFLKLNKIYGLDHDYYENATDLPAAAPKRLVDTIAALPAAQRRKVWIECHGENPADREAMGTVKYYPASMGFDTKYFPYVNQKGYVSPLVAVQFQNAMAGQLIHIECRAYAGNIKYEKRDKIGRAHFELLIHNKQTINNIGM